MASNWKPRSPGPRRRGCNPLTASCSCRRSPRASPLVVSGSPRPPRGPARNESAVMFCRVIEDNLNHIAICNAYLARSRVDDPPNTARLASLFDPVVQNSTARKAANAPIVSAIVAVCCAGHRNTDASLELEAFQEALAAAVLRGLRGVHLGTRPAEQGVRAAHDCDHVLGSGSRTHGELRPGGKGRGACGARQFRKGCRVAGASIEWPSRTRRRGRAGTNSGAT